MSMKPGRESTQEACLPIQKSARCQNLPAPPALDKFEIVFETAAGNRRGLHFHVGPTPALRVLEVAVGVKLLFTLTVYRTSARISTVIFR
jgi:hypothetical protein